LRIEADGPFGKVPSQGFTIWALAQQAAHALSRDQDGRDDAGPVNVAVDGSRKFALDTEMPFRPLPDGVTDLDHFRVRRRDRAGGVLHEYHLVA
jgi:hypothetical protein